MIETLTKPETKFELAPMYYITVPFRGKVDAFWVFTNKGTEPTHMASWSPATEEALILTEKEADKWLTQLRESFAVIYGAGDYSSIKKRKIA